MIPFEFTNKRDCGDATAIYDVSIKKDITIRELIDLVLAEKQEWGYIRIDGEPLFEYRYGMVVSDRITDEDKDCTIKQMIWHGGYSRSDYIILTPN